MPDHVRASLATSYEVVVLATRTYDVLALLMILPRQREPNGAVAATVWL
jgi:hypothetical protein